MGSYLNPGSAGLREGLNSKIHVDKSAMIEAINGHIGTLQKHICVSCDALA